MVEQTNKMMMLKMRTLPPQISGKPRAKIRKHLYRIVIKRTQFLSLQKEIYRTRHFVLIKITQTQTNKHTHTQTRITKKQAKCKKSDENSR